MEVGQRHSFRRRDLWISLIFVFLLLGTDAIAERARLAIISVPELEEEALLLTAALSARIDLEILERAEIAKVLEEERLERHGLTTRDGIRLGGLLKADGLVLLEQTATEVRLRIVAVDSGAIVGFSSAGLPIEQVQAWSALRAAEIAALAPKLRLSSSKLIPVSLMQINSATGGTQGNILEENIGSLLAARLSRAPNFIILERARLHEAVAEKEFEAEKSAFWNSAWVIDGTVTQLSDGFSLDLRLQPPGKDAVRRIQSKAPTLAALVEEANEKIVQVLGGSVAIWESAKEAQHFIDEALWATVNGFWRQAAQAIEAAVAMGESSPEVLQWRWRCYSRLSRNSPGSKPVMGFKPAEGKERPGAMQIAAMTRSLALYHEALIERKLPELEAIDGNHHTREDRPSLFSPRGHLSIRHLSNARARFGKPYNPKASPNLPDWEGSSLLREASQLILAVEEPKSPLDSAEAQALAELRAQMHALFDTMVATLPNLALIPSPDDRVPAWHSGIDPRTTEGREDPGPQNLHQIRLLYGLSWEDEPARYFAYVRECLVNDLPTDPLFFQRVLHLVTENGSAPGSDSTRILNHEKRKAGEAWVREENLRCQVAGAFLLCRAGLPTRGLQVFKRHKELMLNSSLSADYITGALRLDTTLFLKEDNPDESLSKATGVLKELLIHLLDHDAPLTSDMQYSLSRIRFTERQSADLLTAFEMYRERHPFPPEDSRARAAQTLLDSLSRNAKLDANGSSTRSIAQRTMPLLKIDLGRPPVQNQSLSIDRGWFARNYDDAETPGNIQYALPSGDQILLHVEFTQRQSRSVRRQFIVLDLPTLRSRVIHRDTMPEASPFAQRKGPTFASDGEGIYFWNGQGIRYVRAKELRDLKIPELRRPYLWLLDGFLYVADEEGLFLKVDPSTDHYEIIASKRRRPAQNALDVEKDLSEVTRVFRGANGAIAVKIRNEIVYHYDEIKREWLARLPRQLDISENIAAVNYCWDEAEGRFASVHAKELLRKYAPERKNNLQSINPAARYLPAQDNGKKRSHRFVTPKDSTVSDGVLWSLLEESGRNGDHFWLLNLDLSSGAFDSRLVEFKFQYPSFISAASISSAKYRLIPTASGIVIYTHNQPVIWFVPTADLNPSSNE